MAIFKAYPTDDVYISEFFQTQTSYHHRFYIVGNTPSTTDVQMLMQVY